MPLIVILCTGAVISIFFALVALQQMKSFAYFAITITGLILLLDFTGNSYLYSLDLAGSYLLLYIVPMRLIPM